MVSSDIQPMASTCIVYCKIIVSESHCVIWMVVNGKFGMTLKEVGLFFRYFNICLMMLSKTMKNLS